MVPVLVFTVAPFQWRHNARCTTLGSLEIPTIRMLLGGYPLRHRFIDFAPLPKQLAGEDRDKIATRFELVRGSIRIRADSFLPPSAGVK